MSTNPVGATYDLKTQSLRLRGLTAGFSNSRAAFTSPDATTGDQNLLLQSTSTSLQWDVAILRPGPLDVAIRMSNTDRLAGAQLEVDVEGQKLVVVTPSTGGLNQFSTVKVGSVVLDRNGRITLQLRARTLKEEEDDCGYLNGFGYFAWLELSGPAAVGCREDSVPLDFPAASLEPQDREEEYDLCYTSVTPTLSHFGTKFEAFRFNCGWVALCDESIVWGKTIHAPIFRQYVREGDDRPSERDRQCQDADDADWRLESETAFRVADESRSRESEKVTLLKEAPGTKAGNWEYPWKVGETYHFIVKAERARDGKDAVVYSSFVHINDAKTWKLIAMQEVANKTRLISDLRHGIVPRVFGLHQGYALREASFGPTWCRLPGGRWKEMTSYKFTQTKPVINSNAGIKGNRLYLLTGGHTIRICKVGSTLAVESSAELPEMLRDIDRKLTVASEVNTVKRVFMSCKDWLSGMFCSSNRVK